MVNFCAVVGCGNRGDRDKNKSFFRLPSVITNQGQKTEELSQKRRDLWLSRISRADIKDSNLPFTRVCSDHFLTGTSAQLYDINNPDWAPSLKLGHDKVGASPAAVACERYNRSVSRNRKRLEFTAHLQAAASATAFPREDPEWASTESDDDGNCKRIQTHLTASNIEGMEDEISTLMNEKMTLKEKLDSFTVSEDSFMDDAKVKFYTGLPNFMTLMTVFNFISPFLNVTARSSLTKFQQFVMTLMRLRLNLPVQDLAYRFGVSTSTVSRIFTTVVDVMFVRLKFLVKWPSREELRKAMPMTFRVNFQNKVAVIIDCFEIFIDRPSNLMARAQTWSNYKHHNTLKFLIGITPQGVISYISTAWGGRVSDKHLTENCGFLNNILPGDLILADRGFDLADTVGMMCAEIKVPAFMRGKKQLSMAEVIDTRKIANVRIHVERVIGVLRQKYTIMNGPMPLDYMISKDKANRTLIDKIAVVCCALTNLSPSVVPFN